MPLTITVRTLRTRVCVFFVFFIIVEECVDRFYQKLSSREPLGSRHFLWALCGRSFSGAHSAHPESRNFSSFWCYGKTVGSNALKLHKSRAVRLSTILMQFSARGFSGAHSARPKRRLFSTFRCYGITVGPNALNLANTNAIWCTYLLGCAQCAPEKTDFYVFRVF